MTQLCKEPYRLLFPLGILITHVGLGIWILFYFWPEFAYPGRAHAMIQMQSAMLCFVFGFLLTMLPNALGLPSIGKFQLALFTLGLSALSILGAMGQLVAGMAVYLVLLVNFLIFALPRLPRRNRNPPPQFIFIAFALLAGLVGGSLELEGLLGKTPPHLVLLGRGLLHQGFLLLLILGVGGFLFPKLFAKLEVSPQSLAGLKSGFSTQWPILLAGLGIFLSYFVEACVAKEVNSELGIRLGYGMRLAIGVLLLAQLPIWKASGLEYYLNFIRIALVSILAGLALPIVFPQYVMAWQHIIFIPGFLLITIAVASRVIAAHGGNVGILSAHRRWSLTLAILMVMGASSRVSTEIWPGAYLLHLACASFFVLAALWVWSAIFLPLVLRRPLPRS